MRTYKAPKPPPINSLELGCYWCKFRNGWFCKFSFPIEEKIENYGFSCLEDLKLLMPDTSLHIGECCTNFERGVQDITFVFR